MGGNVAWTLRLADGTEHRMDRWTNIFPEITMNDAFLAGEQAAIDEALESWLGMKADWEANRETGKFRHNMTEVYAPYPFGLRPSEYGFIVTDFVTKTIISCQHYTNMTRLFIHDWMLPEQEREPRFSFVQVAKALENASPEEKAETLAKLSVMAHRPVTEAMVIEQAAAEQERDDELAQERGEEMARLTALHAAGRIASFKERIGGKWGFTAADGLPLDEIIRRSLARGGLGFARIKPPEPWKVLDFNSDSPFGRRDAYAAVKQLGFALSPEEISDFETWIAEADAEE